MLVATAFFVLAWVVSPRHGLIAKGRAPRTSRSAALLGGRARHDGRADPTCPFRCGDDLGCGCGCGDTSASSEQVPLPHPVLALSQAGSWICGHPRSAHPHTRRDPGANRRRRPTAAPFPLRHHRRPHLGARPRNTDGGAAPSDAGIRVSSAPRTAGVTGLWADVEHPRGHRVGRDTPRHDRRTDSVRQGKVLPRVIGLPLDGRDVAGDYRLGRWPVRRR